MHATGRRIQPDTENHVKLSFDSKSPARDWPSLCPRRASVWKICFQYLTFPSPHTTEPCHWHCSSQGKTRLLTPHQPLNALLESHQSPSGPGQFPQLYLEPSRWRQQPPQSGHKLGSFNCYTSNLEMTNPVWEERDPVLYVPLKLKELIIDSHQLYSYVSQIHTLLCFCKSSQDSCYNVPLPFIWDCWLTAEQIHEPHEHLFQPSVQIVSVKVDIKVKTETTSLQNLNSKTHAGFVVISWAQSIWDDPEIPVEVAARWMEQRGNTEGSSYLS